MIKSTEKFNISGPILNTTKLGLIRLSVYNSVFNVTRRNNQFLYDTHGETWSETHVLAVIPGAYELTEIAEFINEETYGNVIIEPDKNTMKCTMEINYGALSFDVKNSIASFLGFRKIVHKQGKYTSQKFIDVLVQLTSIVVLYLVLKITQTYYILLLLLNHQLISYIKM